MIVIDEEAQSFDGLEEFDTEALCSVNDELRQQIQAQVQIFEQYLRVAMLQQEQDQLKVVAAENKMANLSSSHDLKVITETVEVQQEQINDSEIAIVVPQYQQNS